MDAFNTVTLIYPDVVNFLVTMLLVIALAIYIGIKEDK
jgi:hypothetical protein